MGHPPPIVFSLSDVLRRSRIIWLTLYRLAGTFLSTPLVDSVLRLLLRDAASLMGWKARTYLLLEPVASWYIRKAHPPLSGDALTRKPRGAVDENVPGGQ